MPIDYNKYPPNWLSEIRPRILKREKNKCKFCQVQNYAVGYRDSFGRFYSLGVSGNQEQIRIILTVAHLDHDEENWKVEDGRLAALCQKCHLKYDATEKQKRIKSKRAIGDLFE